MKTVNSFKPGEVPKGIRDDLIIYDRRRKQDMELLYERKDSEIAQRFKTLGNGREDVGHRRFESTYKFINRIRNKEPEKVGLYGQ